MYQGEFTLKTYRAAVIGCSRMGAFIDNEVVGAPGHVPPYSHTAVFTACDRIDLIACSDLRPEVMAEVGVQFNIPTEKQYTDYKELIDKEQPDIVSVATQPEHRAEIVIYAVEHGAKAIYAEKAMAASMMRKPMQWLKFASGTVFSLTSAPSDGGIPALLK